MYTLKQVSEALGLLTHPCLPVPCRKCEWDYDVVPFKLLDLCWDCTEWQILEGDVANWKYGDALMILSSEGVQFSYFKKNKF